MCSVGDELGDILLELGQVRGDVALSEHSVLVVRLGLSYLGLEASIFEIEYQVLAEKLQFMEL